MKLTVLPNGLLLLFLLPKWIESINGETVDVNTLTKIINFFEQNYKRNDGHDRQYAVAINVPKNQCQPSFNPTPDEFLTQEDATELKNNISNEEIALYQGTDLIAAGTRKVGNNNNPYYKHSESLLLNPVDTSPMTNLLNKREDGCSVFYTFNSPCVDSCLNEKRDHNILKALKNWKEHSGIKAFVFTEFWKFDTEKDLPTKFKQIVAHVPLFRCAKSTQVLECYACNGEENTPIDAHCLPPPVIATPVMQ